MEEHIDIIQGLLLQLVFSLPEGVTCLENSPVCIWVSSQPKEINQTSKELNARGINALTATSKKFNSFVAIRAKFLPTLLEVKSQMESLPKLNF